VQQNPYSITSSARTSTQRQLEEWALRDSRNGIYGIVASGGAPCDAPYSKPFALKTALAAGEVRYVTSAPAASA
jgi:hypothetical protein